MSTGSAGFLRSRVKGCGVEGEILRRAKKRRPCHRREGTYDADCPAIISFATYTKGILWPML